MESARQPWQTTAGMLQGPTWSAARIMDEIYHAVDMVKAPRSKRKVYDYLHKSKLTFNEYLAAVGMPWLKGQGPPPRDHLVVLMNTEGLTEWVSPSVCATLGRERAELLGKPAREVLKQHRVSTADTEVFLSIAHELCTGERVEGSMTSSIPTADGREQPLEVHITYGRLHHVYFMDCVLIGEPRPMADEPSVEVFNVKPGILSPHYARIDDVEAIHRFLNASPEEQHAMINDLLSDYRPPERPTD